VVCVGAIVPLLLHLPPHHLASLILVALDPGASEAASQARSQINAAEQLHKHNKQ